MTFLTSNKGQKVNKYIVLTEDIKEPHDYTQFVKTEIKPPFTKLSMLARSWIYHKEVSKIRKSFVFTHFVCFDPILGFFSLLFLRKTSVKCICFINDDNNIFPFEQDSFSKKLVRFLYQYLQALSIRYSQLVIVNSCYLKKIITSSYHNSNLSLLYKGVDVQTFCFRPNKTINLDTVIRILFIKSNYIIGGLEILLKALSGLVLQFELTIIGPRESEVKNLMSYYRSKSNLEMKITDSSNRTQIAAHLHHSHILCVPSLREALGVANLEALACGTPVVSTTAGGIPEATDNGRVAWLCEPGSVEGLKKAIMDCLNDPDQRNNKIIEGRKWVESKFDIHKQCEKFIELLAECKD
jgi:glycosyltransferase involved in cell wall biosynthesis